ncbi:putative DEAD-box ATP-dependent RNA helicase 28 [Paratrimastix pyriformis]|uniref:DEAD-box ATP-dependent RNA helicase 28 n=1 Tax=Paratrimastix pyriformis TaxID=342808 RepID=A0ABQ8UTZ3_9EUKA|nr:putative DEAD-box ATP-dependent RNA helicase 28 [Paratrimastix pyriformis]
MKLRVWPPPPPSSSNTRPGKIITRHPIYEIVNTFLCHQRPTPATRSASLPAVSGLPRSSTHLMEEWIVEKGAPEIPDEEVEEDDDDEMKMAPSFSFTEAAQSTDWLRAEDYVRATSKRKQPSLDDVVSRKIEEVRAERKAQEPTAPVLEKVFKAGKRPSKPAIPTPEAPAAPISAAPKPAPAPAVAFTSLGLSKPVLRSLLGDMHFELATPIQVGWPLIILTCAGPAQSHILPLPDLTLSYTAQCIPHGLEGRDILGSAVTGSGKTAAFGVPIIERILKANRKHPQIRALVLSPTRELALQTQSMLKAMAAHTDLTAEIAVGGLPLREQEQALRLRPDIVVATPGRLIDLLHNTPAVTLANLEILVLDEADRLLEMGFRAEVEEILRMCPPKRQTMLFSATMTDEIAELAVLSLDKPVRVAVDKEFEAPRHSCSERDAVLLSLCERSFPEGGVVIFAHTRNRAHRLYVLLKLAGLSVKELHGGLTQPERLFALEAFRQGVVAPHSRIACRFLVSTDLAARGLDIDGVRAVISYDPPRTLREHIHRAGRTARAGREGRCLTFFDKVSGLLREIVAHCPDRLLRRKISPAVMEHFQERVASLDQDVQRILADETVEREIRNAEVEVERASNKLEHADEIAGRPARTWFQSAADKKQAKTGAVSQMRAESNADHRRGMEAGKKHGRGAPADDDDAPAAGGMKRSRKAEEALTKTDRKHAHKIARASPKATKTQSGPAASVRAAVHAAKKSLRLPRAGMEGPMTASKPAAGARKHKKPSKPRAAGPKKADKGGHFGVEKRPKKAGSGPKKRYLRRRK